MCLDNGKSVQPQWASTVSDEDEKLVRGDCPAILNLRQPIENGSAALNVNIESNECFAEVLVTCLACSCNKD